MPPVEPGVTCALEEVLEKAGKRAQVFVKNVERFTASEFLKQETIDKWGIAGAAETRKFNYVAAIEEPQPGFLIVEEYRDSGGSPAEFPGGVETSGLAALALIFHPYYAGNFDMTCEGLTRWNGTCALPIYFRQRRDKPNTVRSYRLGLEGPSYPVALKGRAWILRDSFDIARLETDLIAPVPQIKLVADHTAIEYGPVRFHIPDAEMWLPQSAEVYYDWRGKRIHRRHSFSHYLLFVVDRSEEHTSELQSRLHLVCRLLPEKKTTSAAAAPTSPRHRRVSRTSSGPSARSSCPASSFSTAPSSSSRARPRRTYGGLVRLRRFC